MHGTGVPLVTPFSDGAIDHERLRSLVEWLERSGVDFLVPCGSTGEGPSLTTAERATVVETVVDATELPVLAGTGREALEPTVETTALAAEAGADAALVVTPSYYGADNADLAAYYRALADRSPLPIYLYSVPKFTGRALAPEFVAELASHEDVAGIKDSSGSLGSVQRLVDHTDDDFDVLVGSGSVYAAGITAGADGGVLAVANVVPERASAVFGLASAGRTDTARERNAAFVELNHAVTARFGVPGVKAALAMRDQSVGRPRRPLRPLEREDEAVLESILERTLGE
ncbi:dihydrodipicolinate synthase family protein [Natronococcus occultus]|uniref:Dihydrodipicolinate synthase/N-acetylneuraminate lyase n=1 Tax=Natronococcus occultus SP4 TaxID=694430 RepID=L0JY34_9EURY|nr:dihydrodipicolinate synthase family protein [Natronococcus occultus]AGB37947.1 dihydrodipicolinate synthase/N-acetylneuraminate lyase [Natronococcus occultus SP4]